MKNLKRARDSRRAFPLAWAVLFCVFATSDTSVILQTNNLTLDPFSDLPADFGPRIPPQGVSGLLKVAVPEDACQSLRNKPVFEPRVFVEETPHTSSDVAVVSQPWIALISRSQGHQENCTFDVKVRNAQRAGAIAAIVYDDVYEQLLIMSKPQAAEEPGIPSVFVSKKTGLILKQMMVPGVSTVHISPMDAIWGSMLMSAFAGVLAVCVVIATFYFIRSGEEGMTAAEVAALPVVIHEGSPPPRQPPRKEGKKPQPPPQGGEVSASSLTRDFEEAHSGIFGGGTRRTCAICLEDYEHGQKLRVLPCAHRFHVDCIDQWLMMRRPFCPVCKHDATKKCALSEPPPGPGPYRLITDDSRIPLLSSERRVPRVRDHIRHWWQRRRQRRNLPATVAAPGYSPPLAEAAEQGQREGPEAVLVQVPPVEASRWDPGLRRAEGAPSASDGPHSGHARETGEQAL
uniref:RING-type E3 ubiquitin transferase n=1 Tax=Tetraselmis sp. GSL018 TaxID=582737 RepID=A0A061R0T1_9CHLO